MLTYEEALQHILQATPAPRTAQVKLQGALGLVLAQPIIARSDLPGFDNSAVDGYAVRSTDHEQGSPMVLHVDGQSSAGRPYRDVMRAGQAVRIFTGAAVPSGAEAVVMQEHVKRQGGRLIIPPPVASPKATPRSEAEGAALRQATGGGTINSWPTPGQHIRRQGEDLHRGTEVLAAGTRLRPQHLGLLAALGRARVSVHPPPTMAILTTGDELQPAGARLKAGQIYESNGLLLGALAQQTGARAANLGQARDTIDSLMQKLRRGLACDLLVIAGGVSVGEKDLVRTAARRCGVRELFWRVNIKPGMPLFVGRRRRTLIFGLPGNPVSVFVTFEEFVKPALHRLMGRPWVDGYTTPAVLADALRVSTTRQTHFLRVRCAADGGQLVAYPTNGQGSHQLHSLAQADGWIRMAADQGPWPAGTPVLVKQETA